MHWNVLRQKIFRFENPPFEEQREFDKAALINKTRYASLTEAESKNFE